MIQYLVHLVFFQFGAFFNERVKKTNLQKIEFQISIKD